MGRPMLGLQCVISYVYHAMLCYAMCCAGLSPNEHIKALMVVHGRGLFGTPASRYISGGGPECFSLYRGGSTADFIHPSPLISFHAGVFLLAPELTLTPAVVVPDAVPCCSSAIALLLHACVVRYCSRYHAPLPFVFFPPWHTSTYVRVCSLMVFLNQGVFVVSLQSHPAPGCVWGARQEALCR